MARPAGPGAPTWAAAALALVAAAAATWYVSSISDLVVRFTPQSAWASWAWSLPIAIGIVTFAWRVAGRRGGGREAAGARRAATVADLLLCAGGTVVGGLLLVVWGPAFYTEKAGEPHTEPASVHQRADGQVQAQAQARNECIRYAVRVRPAGSDDLVTWCDGRDAWARLVPGRIVLASWRSSMFGTVGTKVDFDAAP